MAFRLRRVVPLVLALAVLAALVAAPAVARADSLSWVLEGSLPLDIKNPPYDDTPVAGAFNGVSFSGQMTGCAVGGRIDNVNPQSLPLPKSFVAVTYDGGHNWDPVPSVTTANQLWAVDAVSATEVWAVGAAGTIVHLKDGVWTASTPLGSSWASSALRGVAFADSLHGWVVGDAGAAYTADGGATWTNITAPALNAVAVVSPTTVVAVGNSGAIRRLVGATPQTLPSGTSQKLSGVAFADGGLRGVAAGDNATARLTVNGGTTWTPISLPIPDAVPPAGSLTADMLDARSVAFSGASVAIVTGTYETVWRTFDGGLNWAPGRILDPHTDQATDLRGAAFVGGLADSPYAVGRAYNSQLTSNAHKARAFLGSWSGRVLPPPTAPNTVTTQRATPGPRVRVDWIDASADEDGFVVQRAKDSSSDGAFSTVATLTAGTTSWTDTSADWDSTWYYRVRSYRGDLVSTWAVSGGFVVDVLAPTTTSNAKLAYILEAHILLTPQDEEDGSGVERTFYTIDTVSRVGAHQGTDFVVTGIGEHTIRYWSEDVAGNVENPGGEFTFAINPTPPVPDEEAPVTTTDVSGSHEGSVTVRLDATDTGGADVAEKWYALNGGPSLLYSDAFTVSVPAAYTMEYWSVDAAGNKEDTKTAEFVVSAVAPPVTSTSVPAYYLNSASISVSATDGPHGSGVASTFMKVDGGAAVATTTVRATGLGAHSVSFWSVDELGNVEVATTRDFAIVSTPSSKGTPSTPAAIATHKAETSFTVSGYMKSYSKTYSAKLYFYKKNKSGTYVYYKARTAKSSTALTFLRYAYTTSVPTTGKWRVRARRVVVGSTVRYSGWEYFTVN